MSYEIDLDSGTIVRVSRPVPTKPILCAIAKEAPKVLPSPATNDPDVSTHDSNRQGEQIATTSTPTYSLANGRSR